MRFGINKKKKNFIPKSNEMNLRSSFWEKYLSIISLFISIAAIVTSIVLFSISRIDVERFKQQERQDFYLVNSSKINVEIVDSCLVLEQMRERDAFKAKGDSINLGLTLNVSNLSDQQIEFLGVIVLTDYDITYLNLLEDLTNHNQQSLNKYSFKLLYNEILQSNENEDVYLPIGNRALNRFTSGISVRFIIIYTNYLGGVYYTFCSYVFNIPVPNIEREDFIDDVEYSKQKDKLNLQSNNSIDIPEYFFLNRAYVVNGYIQVKYYDNVIHNMRSAYKYNTRFVNLSYKIPPRLNEEIIAEYKKKWKWK